MGWVASRGHFWPRTTWALGQEGHSRMSRMEFLSFVRTARRSSVRLTASELATRKYRGESRTDQGHRSWLGHFACRKAKKGER